MVFKVVSGVQADIYQLWSSASSQNENNTESLNVGSSLKAHYKNRLVQNWQSWHLKEVCKSFKGFWFVMVEKKYITNRQAKPSLTI